MAALKKNSLLMLVTVSKREMTKKS